MSRPAEALKIMPRHINVDHLVTEDDTPVDNLFAEKQHRLLAESLENSWQGPGDGRPFIAVANVGLYYDLNRPPLVPDMMLSLDVRYPEDIWVKHNRVYFTWEYGKPPDVVVEVVSNKKGGELSSKLDDYARAQVRYYVVFDPVGHISAKSLRVFELHGSTYIERIDARLPDVRLSLAFRESYYGHMWAEWLCWVDSEGRLVADSTEIHRQAAQIKQQAAQETCRADREARRAEQETLRAEEEARRAEQETLRAEEEAWRAEQETLRAEEEARRAEQAARRAEQEARRAEQAESRAEQEALRAARLAEKLRALGIDPNE